jgi:hypothetical protein
MPQRHTIEVGITVKDDGSISVQKFNEELEKTDEGLKDAENAGSKFGNSFDNFVTGAYQRAGQMATEFLSSIPGQIVELGKLGVQSEAASLRFERFAGSSERAEELLIAFQSATDGTVDKMGAMTSAGRLLQMGLVSNADEMANVASIATKLGDQTLSATDRVADFSALLANQSIPRLDNFGISSGRVRTRIAELQAATKGLSREQAFNTAVMEEGRKALDRLGDTSELASVKIDKLKAAVQDAKIGVGELGVEMVSGAGGVDDLSTRIRGLPATLDQVIILTQAWGHAIGTFLGEGGGFRGMGAAFADFTGQLKANAIAQADVIESTEILQFANTQALPTLVDLSSAAGNTTAWQQYQDALAESQAESDRSIAASNRYRDELLLQQRAVQNSILEQNNLAIALKDATATNIATTAISQLGEAFKEADDPETREAILTAMNETALEFGLADEASVRLSERLLALNEGLINGTTAAVDYDEALVNIVAINEAENLQLEKFGGLLTDTIPPLNDTAESIIALETAEDGAARSAQNARTFIDRQREASGKLTTQTLDASVALTDFSKSIGRIPDVKTVTIRVNYETSGNVPPGIPSGRGDVPGFQSGGFAAGAAIVGEAGPELAFFPRGANIMNNANTRNITNNNSFTQINNSPSPRADQDFLFLQSMAQQ